MDTLAAFIVDKLSGRDLWITGPAIAGVAIWATKIVVVWFGRPRDQATTMGHKDQTA